MAGTSAASDASMGAAPNQTSAGLRQSRRRVRDDTASSNLATVERGVAPEIVNHYNVQPVFDVYANVDRRDLGSVAPRWRRS